MKYIGKITLFGFMLILILVLCAFNSNGKMLDNKVSNTEEIISLCKEEQDYSDSSGLKIIEIDGVPYTSISKFDIGYEKLININPENIDELSLKDIGVLNSINSQESSTIAVNKINKIIEVSDGFIISSMLKQDINGFGENDEFYKPCLTKVDKNGVVIWNKTYNYLLMNGVCTNFEILNNEDIIITIYGKNMLSLFKSSTVSYPITYVIRINNKGKELWCRSFHESMTFLSENLFKNIIITENNEIIGIGIKNTACPPKTGEDFHRDIVLMKISSSGEILKQRSFGGVHDDDIRSISYSKEFNLVLIGVTESIDGDFYGRKADDSRSFIARLDDELNTIWFRTSTLDNAYNNRILLSNKSLIVTKHLYNENYEETFGLIEIYDRYGKKISSVKNNLTRQHFRLSANLKSGFILGCGNGVEGELLIYNSKIITVKNIKLKYSPDEIIATNDGGFIVKSIRNIKTIPQPLYISSIWFDTEVVLEKYNSSYELEWRKTYNKYENDTKIDYVQPLPSSKVIVE